MRSRRAERWRRSTASTASASTISSKFRSTDWRYRSSGGAVARALFTRLRGRRKEASKSMPRVHHVAWLLKRWCVDRFSSEHTAQCLNYLRVSGVGDLKDGTQPALGQPIQLIGVPRRSSAAKLKCRPSPPPARSAGGRAVGCSAHTARASAALRAIDGAASSTVGRSDEVRADSVQSRLSLEPRRHVLVGVATVEAYRA